MHESGRGALPPVFFREGSVPSKGENPGRQRRGSRFIGRFAL